MRLASRHQRFTSWLAMGLLVLSACLPLASQVWLSSQSAPHWVQICTGTGMVWVQLGDSSDATVSPGDPSGEEQSLCPWCLVCQASAALKPGAAHPIPVVAHVVGHGYLTRAPPLSSVSWHPVQPGAPPAFA